MAYTLPEFNLTCNIYTGPWLTKVLRISPDCNLAMSKRVQEGAVEIGVGFGFSNPTMSLLLPPLTDVRDASGASEQYDIIECPAGSSRWYGVLGVDDIGKGFANEHRVAFISKLFQAQDPTPFAGAIWPTPIP